MAYGKTYRGLFSNTLDDAGNVPVDQVVRIDINDTAAGANGETIVGNIIIIGSSALSVAPAVISPPASLAIRTALWQTFADFFTAGKQIRITGSAISDGVYTIVGPVDLFPPTNVVSDDPGSLTMLINTPAPLHSGDEGVTFESIVTTEIIPLRMSGDPLHISVIDNDEDKFTPIRSKQAEIKIKTGNGIDINTFCEGEDQRYYVEIFIDDLIIFRGFLMIPDMQQDFMPDPNDLLLVATDNLPLLKDIALVDAGGDVPELEWKLIDYIQWCLRRTGIIQNINIINSVKHGSGGLVSDVIFNVDGDGNFQVLTPATDFFYANQRIRITGTVSNDGEFTVKGSALLVVQDTIVYEAVVSETSDGILFEDISSEGNFYDIIFLDAKTFERQIGTREDCYTVLQKILGEDCVLFQYQGEWWLVRIDEIEEISGTFQYSVDHYDSDGAFISNEIIAKSKNIGAPDIMHFMNDDAIVIPDRAYLSIKETFRYENPLEIVCNVDFSRGDFIDNLPDVAKDGFLYNAKSYDLDNWEVARFTHLNKNPDSPTTAEHYIERLFQNGYEKERFAVAGSADVSESDPDVHLRSCPIRVAKNDKFSISIDIKLSETVPGNNLLTIGGMLYGDDGTVWELGELLWLDRTAITPGGSIDLSAIAAVILDYTDDSQKTQWTTTSIQSFPVPVNGVFYIYLVGSYGYDTYWQNLQFNYSPFVNGSYQRYTSQYHQVSQVGNNKAIREKQVYMSDSPSLLLKGAMKFFNGTFYALTFGFKDAHNLTAVPFGQIQAFAVWNQYRLSARNFDGEVKRLESETVDGDGKYDGVDLIDKIELTDSNPSTVNRYFLILHYDIDYYLLEMKCYIASLYRTDEGKIYTNNHSFIYTTE